MYICICIYIYVSFEPENMYRTSQSDACLDVSDACTYDSHEPSTQRRQNCKRAHGHAHTRSRSHTHTHARTHSWPRATTWCSCPTTSQSPTHTASSPCSKTSWDPSSAKLPLTLSSWLESVSCVMPLWCVYRHMYVYMCVYIYIYI